MSVATPQIPSTPYPDRQERLTNLLIATKLDALALNPGPSLEYLTGLSFHLSERPVVAFFTIDRRVVIVHPELEAEKLNQIPYPAETFAYGEDPQTWVSVFRQAIQRAGLGPNLPEGKTSARIGVEPRRMRLLEYQLLEEACAGAEFPSAQELIAQMRMLKDESEIAAMRSAVAIAQTALQATLPLIQIGMSERELAAELVVQLLKAGADTELPFSPIVSAGPNSANPHAVPGSRPLSPGDLLVIDWGATYNGYISDLTRTFAIGKALPEAKRIAQIVLEANAAGRATAAPGIPASQVDLAARNVIERAGYGDCFTHRTGHGIGRESHEEPYLRSDNPMPLQRGMTFTVEPGIYLRGLFGVRIEDDLVVTAEGAESLSDLGRELLIIE